MKAKKSDSKTSERSVEELTGRIAGLKIARDSCEFHVKDGKSGSRTFAVDSKAGLQFNAVIELLSAAWAGNRKITVQPMAGDGMERAVASISVGNLPKPPKPPKTEMPAKSKTEELAAA
jgi:hypothetical protein